MASRALKLGVKTMENDMVPIMGIINIASDATVSSVEGKGFTASKTATGTYTLVMDDAWGSFRNVQVSMLAATAVDLVAQVVSHNSATKSVVIKTLTGATATSAGAVCALHVLIWARNSTI